MDTFITYQGLRIPTESLNYKIDVLLEILGVHGKGLAHIDQVSGKRLLKRKLYLQDRPSFGVAQIPSPRQVRVLNDIGPDLFLRLLRLRCALGLNHLFQLRVLKQLFSLFLRHGLQFIKLVF